MSTVIELCSYLEAYCSHREEPHVGTLRKGREAQQRHGHDVFAAGALAATAGDCEAVCSHVTRSPERGSSQAARATATAATTTAAAQVADGARARWCARAPAGRPSSPPAAAARALPAAARDGAPLRAHRAPARGARGSRANPLAAPAAGGHFSGAYRACIGNLIRYMRRAFRLSRLIFVGIPSGA